MISTSVPSDRLMQARSWPHLSAMAFAVLFLVSIAVGANAVLSLADLALSSQEYSHLVLIVPLSAFLMWCERKPIFATPNARLRSALICFGLWGLTAAVLDFFAKELLVNERLTTVVLLLVTFWLAAFWACFGANPARKALFPLMFVFLLVPIPRGIEEATVTLLQRTSGDVLNVLYGLAGVPVFRNGQVFVLSNMQLEIARECSGIRSATALLITGLLLGHFFLKYKRSKVALIIAVLPLAIFKNAVRIFAISVLANYVDPSFMNSPLHHNGGILFFALALFFLILLLFFLLRVERRYRKTTMARPLIESPA